MSDANKLLTVALRVGLNRTPEEVASLYDEAGNPKEDAEEQINTWRNEQVAAEKEKTKQLLGKQRESLLRQGAQLFEKKVSEGLGLDFAGAEGDDAVEVIRKHIEAASANAKGVDPKDEQAIRNSKPFRDEQTAMAKKYADREKEHEATVTKIQAEFQRKETLRTVKADALELLAELKAVLPDDPKVKANQLRLLDLHLEGAQFEKDGDTWIVKDKDGNVIETPQGHQIKYKDFLKEGITANFPLAAATQKTSAGDPNKGSKPSTGSGSGTLKKPASREEETRMRGEINKNQDAAERKKLHAELDELVKV